METKEMKAEISKKFSKSAWILLGCWVGFFLLFTILGFTLFNETSSWGSWESTYLFWYGIEYGYGSSGKTYFYNGGGWFVLVLFINLLLLALVPAIYFLVNMRQRKLTELTANEKEIVGSYTGFIPISKITLKMPIEKIDNIAAVKNFFFLYTGKALRIASTSSVIRIPFVDNADEIVAFISEMIEKAKGSPKVAQPAPLPQTDATDSLKKLAELRDAGIITEEEFNQKKNELLGKI